MFAVVKTGGKQYRVSPGDVIVVEKLLGDAGAKIKLDQVLMVGEDGQAPEVGAPRVGSAAVNCEILDQTRPDKILVFKKKRRQGYKRTKGHRQDQTVLHVLDINGKGAVASRADAKPAKKADPKPAAEDKAAKKKARETKKKAAGSRARQEKGRGTFSQFKEKSPSRLYERI